jgi:predicted ATPase
MSIRKLIVSNFKSFDRIDVDLPNLGIIIGANASGKSNFIQIFKFLRDISQFGLENAISMQGGPEYLLNTKLGSSCELSIEVISDKLEQHPPTLFASERSGYGYEVVETSYSFTIDFGRKGSKFRIPKDLQRQKCKFYTYKRRDRQVEKDDYLGEGEILIDCSKPSLRFLPHLPPELPEKKLTSELFEFRFASKYMNKIRIKPKQLLLETSLGFPFEDWEVTKKLFRNIAIYNFDPRLSKKAQLVTGRAALEEDGSNLAIVINNIIKNTYNRLKFYNLLNDLLPFVQRFQIQTIADNVLFTLRESYAGGQSFPAFLLSDGTINLTSIIICLFFEEKSLKIIEEPERNIHPHLISRVMDLMKEESDRTQIITTTHNPEVIRHADLGDILLVSRKRDGFSTISRPINEERVRSFLQEEMGIDELYVQNLL